MEFSSVIPKSHLAGGSHVENAPVIFGSKRIVKPQLMLLKSVDSATETDMRVLNQY